MTTPLVLGIDVGTGSAKGVLADVSGQLFASASSQYKYASPEPYWAEQDPEDWWRAVCMVCRELLASVPDAATRLQGMAVSGQGVAAVVLDDKLQPVRPAILWMDTRASRQAEELESICGDVVLNASGKSPAAYALEPKLLWMRQHEPEKWNRVTHVMTTTAYINLRLTGTCVMNHSDAGVLLCYDLRARTWSKEALDCMGLDPRLFPPVAGCTSIIGAVTHQASIECGLPEGTPVLAGGEDTSSAGLAMGVIEEGDVQLSAGTACTVYIPNRSIRLDPRLLTFPHVLPGLTLTGGSMVCGGISVEWLMELLGAKDTARNVKSEELAELSRQAADVPAGAGGLIFLPYLAGELQPVNDGFARGVLFGLTLDTKAPHLLRAIMEGTGFAVRHNLDIAREVGASAKQILAVGGPSKNDLWCQTIANVTGLPLRVMDDQAGAALGDALLAALGLGLVNDSREMQRAHTRVRKEYSPVAVSMARYDELYLIYRQLYPRLRDLFPPLRSAERT